LILKIVFCGLIVACLFADSPTLIPSFVNATIEGVLKPPSEFGITFTSFPSYNESYKKRIKILHFICFLFIVDELYIHHLNNLKLSKKIPSYCLNH